MPRTSKATAQISVSLPPSECSPEQLRTLALQSYWHFIELIQYKGGVKAFGTIHERLVTWISDEVTHPRRLILMPRGHLKSTICSVGYALWRIYRNPNIRILVGTATKPLANAFVREIKQYLEDQHLQESVWNHKNNPHGNLIPQLEGTGNYKSKRKRNRDDDYNSEEEFTEAQDKKVVWRADAIQVLRDKIMKEPTLQASSVGSPDTGFHYDLVIMDDVVSFDNSDTSVKGERIMNWVGDQESVCDPYDPTTGLGGEFVVLGTRYFKRDLYGILSGEDLDEDELEEKDEEDTTLGDDFALFKCNIYNNGIDDSEGYLWSERFNGAVIERIRKRMLKLPNGARRFASQYLNTIMTAEEQVLDPEKIQYIHSSDVRPQLDGMVHVHPKGSMVPIRVKPFCVIDPAISQAKRADNTVILVGGVDEDKNLYGFDIRVGKFSPTETVNLTYELLDKWSINSVTVDSEKLGQALMHTFRTAFATKRVILLRDYKAEGEKKARIETHLEPLFSNSMFYLVGWMATHKQLQEEVAFFPRQGIHDDILDCFAMLNHVAIPSRTRRTNPKRSQGRYAVNRKYGGTR